MPLQPHRDADAGGTRGGEPIAERDDARTRQAGDPAHALGRAFQYPAAERLPAERVGLDELAILAAAGDDDVEQPQGETGIGPRSRRQVLVRRDGGAGADRIDRHHVGPVAASGLDVLPQVMIRRERVGAPQEDQAGGAERLGVHADAVVTERVAGAPPAIVQIVIMCCEVPSTFHSRRPAPYTPCSAPMEPEP